jgi:hypothetical protein
MLREISDVARASACRLGTYAEPDVYPEATVGEEKDLSQLGGYKPLPLVTARKARWAVPLDPGFAF